MVWADGRLYVSTLTGFPFVDEQARVIGVEPDGVTFDAARGLTTLTDVALDPRDGALTALRFALFRLDADPPGFVFGTGRATRLGDDLVLADMLPLATGAAYGPDGTLYVSTIIGVVFRVEVPQAAIDTELLSPYRIDAPAGSASRYTFSVEATNTTDAPMEVDVWAVAEIVGIDERRVVNEGTTGTLEPGETARVDARQTVKAASGDRTIVYTIYVGDKDAGDPAAGDGAMAHEQIVIRQEGGADLVASGKSGDLALAEGSAEWAALALAPEAALTASPNPTRGRLSVGFDLNADSDVRVTLHDALGREVAVLASGPLASGPHRAEADLSALAPASTSCASRRPLAWRRAA